MVSDFLINEGIEPASLVEKNPNLKFLFPVRHPIACAKSNMKMDNIRQDHYYDCNNFIEAMERNLKFFSHFLTQYEKYPSNFYYFYEHQFNQETLNSICNFFQIPYLDSWANFVMENMKSKNNYNFSQDALQTYHRMVLDNFSNYPGIRENLLKFVN